MISAITNSNQYVVYYRVSTQKQGASGLGLEAQKASVISFLGKGLQLPKRATVARPDIK
jgi:hypothetical protein